MLVIILWLYDFDIITEMLKFLEMFSRECQAFYLMETMIKLSSLSGITSTKN